MHNPRLPEVNVGEMSDADDDCDSGLCALERCNRERHVWDRCCESCFLTEGQEHDQFCDEISLCALKGCDRVKQYPHGCDWDRCCKRCFVTEGEQHDPCCDRRACDNGQRSLEETENNMTAAEEDGPTAAARPAAAEEGDRTAAAASAASQENDVCSYCQYRGRKLKHTQDS